MLQKNYGYELLKAEEKLQMKKLIPLIICLIASFNSYSHQIISDLSDGNIIDYQFKYNLNKHEIEVVFRDCIITGEDPKSKFYIVSDCETIKTFNFKELNRKIDFYENELENLGPVSILSFKILKETRNDFEKVRSVVFSHIITPENFSDYLTIGAAGAIGFVGWLIIDSMLFYDETRESFAASALLASPFAFINMMLATIMIEELILDEQIENFLKNIKEIIETNNIQQFERKLIHLKNSSLNEIIGELNKN